MTREEAIKILEAGRNPYHNIDTDTWCEAFEIAIEALKQEPCDDAISRQAAIDAFERFIHELGIKDEPYNYGEMALSVQNVPSIKPQEKTGHWIRGHHGFGCSNCHKSIEGKWDDNIDDITGTLFCPNCEAKMVEK